MASLRIPRSRFWISVSIMAVITLGLASRKFPFLFPTILGKYPGDALWAVTVFLVWAFVQSSAPIKRLAVFAWVTSGAVEITQLYQAAWINAIRSTTVGHLVLGSTFSWLDLAAYTAGVAMRSFLDHRFSGTTAAHPVTEG